MPKKDFISVIRSERTDPTVLYLFDTTLGMELAGYGTDEIFRDGLDGEKSARSLIATARRFGLDACNGSVVWLDSRVLGNKVVFPPKGTPYISEFSLSEPSRLCMLDNSSIPKRHLDQIVLSHTIVAESTDCGLVSHIPSPLGTASSLRGMENILMDMLLEPDYLRSLLLFSEETILIVQERIAGDVDIDMCLISGAYDNIDLLGPDLLGRYSTGPLRTILGRVSEPCGSVCFHPHGILSSEHAADTIKKYQSLGIDCLYYGEFNDPRIIHDIVPGMSLMGGVDTFTTIALGGKERVMRDTSDCIGRIKDVPHVFSCSCSVYRGLPVNNLDTMCRTVKLSTFS